MFTQKSSRLIVITSILIVIAAITANANWGSWLGSSLFGANGSDSASASGAEPAAPLFTAGTCDGGLSVDVESTGGTPVAGYATLGAAFSAINAGTHTGTIIVEICTSTSEGATPATLNSGDAAPASYASINIYPIADGVTVSGAPVTGFGVIQLNGADNVTINGDNPNSAGINRNLTVANTAANTVAANSVIRIAVAAGAVVSADNNTIKNLILNGNVTSGNAAAITSATSSSGQSYGIYAGGGATTATGAPAALTTAPANAPSGTTINALTVDNNVINQCARGVFFNGAASTVSSGVTITNNTIGDTGAVTDPPPYTAPATTVYVMGVGVSGTNATTITGNTIKNIISYVGVGHAGVELTSAIGSGTLSVSNNAITNVVVNSAATTNFYARGVSMASAAGAFTVAGNTVTNIQNFSSSSTNQPNGIFVLTAAPSGTIESNKVTTVINRSTGTFGSQGVTLSGGNNLTVQNNFIADVNQVMTGGTAFSTTFGVHGLRVAGGTGHKIYHNSVNMFGSLLGTATTAQLTSAFCITATTLTGVDVRNNIFSNTMTGGTTSIAHVSMSLPVSGTSTMNLTLNNNDYFSGTTAGSQGIAHVGTTYTATPAGPTTYAGLYTAANFNPADTTVTTNLRTYTNTLQTTTGNDSASKVVDPLFVSSTDLHITTLSSMESMGANVGVTTDIDGDARGGAPDIGADEITLAGPGTLEFSAASYTGLEGELKTITVNRVGGIGGAVQVNYSTGGGTATGGAACTAGVDYISVSGTLNWANNDGAAKTFNVQLCNDAVVDTELVQLTLSGVVGTTITGTNPVPLNITDNPPGTIQFSSVTYNGDEGTSATITATRTGGTGGAVQVNYTTGGGSATAGGACGGTVDYVTTAGTLSWATTDGADKTFTVPLCTDANTGEGPETVNLTLSAVTGGATIGANNPATLTINDVGSVFCNADGAMTIPAGAPTTTTGPSAPYPSTVVVSGLTGVTSTVKVTLNTITHTFGNDIDMLLVSPTGQTFILMSDAGDSAGLDAPVTLKFVDGGNAIPLTGQIPTGTYAPTDITSGDTFVAPAPAGPYVSPAPVGAGTLNGTFAGQNPNGTWSLYVVDDVSGDVGSMASWCLELTTSVNTPTATNTPTPSSTATQTNTATATNTPSASPTPTNTATATNTPTASPSATFTATPTAACTPTNFANPAAITINDNAAGSPYPSTIAVSGLTGNVYKVTVKLNGMTHTFPGDIDMLLVAPDGTTNAVIMSDAGGSDDIVGVNLTLDDDAAASIPSALLTTGTYKATNNGVGDDPFPTPAPTPVTGSSSLLNFVGTNPNGTWSLYVVDDAATDSGSISGGWELNITTNVCGTPTNTATASPTPTNTFTPTNTATATNTTTPTNTATPTPTPGCGSGTFSYTGPVVAITDNSPAGVNFTIPVSGAGTVNDINFSFDGTQDNLPPATTVAGIGHSWVGDLIVKVTAPGGGPTVTILDRPGVPTTTVGCSNNNLAQIILDDDGGFPAVEDQCNITGTTTNNAFPTGSFSPNNPLSAFDGINPNGDWTINISDNASIDTGSARAFSIIIDGACVGTPTATATATNTFTPTPSATATNTATATSTNTPTPAGTATNTPTPGGDLVQGTITYGNPASPTTKFISNATVASTVGSPLVTTTTAAPGGTAGQYTLTGFGAGNYTVGVTKTTGQNGISSNDAARVAQHVAGTVLIVSARQRISADTTGNGGISSQDAAKIAQFVAGLPPTAPQFTNTWRFFVPSLTEPTFPIGASPTTRSYTAPIGTQTGQDYIGILIGETTGNWTAGPLRPAQGPTKSTAIAAPQLVTPADNEVLIPVAVQGAANKGIISYEFDLRYDPAVIQPQADVVDVTGTASKGLMAVANPNEPGLLRVVVYGAYPIDTNGVLMNLKFTAVGAPGTISPLTWERVMFNEGDPGTVATNGQVELSAAAPNQAELTGRVVNAMGQGIANARVTMTDTTGQTRSVMSNGFGVYRFGGLNVGQTFTITVNSKALTFTPLTVSVTGQSVTVDMIATQ